MGVEGKFSYTHCRHKEVCSTDNVNFAENIIKIVQEKRINRNFSLEVLSLEIFLEWNILIV